MAPDTGLPKSGDPERMTKGERTELLQLIRKRERVMIAAAEDRTAAMLAEFERQTAAIYKFNDDAVWKEAMAKAEAAVVVAAKDIAYRCEELGIPKEYAPSINLTWYGRGENAVEKRQAEMRRAAKAKIEAIRKETVARIERMSLEAQTDLQILWGIYHRVENC